MAKKKVIYECLACGYESPRWLGKCPNCGAWNQMEEQIDMGSAQKSPMHVQLDDATSQGAMTLDRIEYRKESRMLSEFEEFNRVLGGGIVAGSLVLIGGDPGIGKSTLLLQISIQLAQGKRVLYVSGEESLSQIKMRADRIALSSDQFYVLAETDLSLIAANIQQLAPDVVIIDSIQTMMIPDYQGSAGSVGQIRQATSILMTIAKTNQIATFIVGHVTKEGNISGPRMLEHMVDTVLYFEGEQHNRFRLLRAVKNRFGPTNELGVFEMEEAGLKEVVNPSQIFLEERVIGATGSAIVPSLEGTRTILAEIQVLLTPTVYGNARRTATGIDTGRISLLLAVMEKHCNLLLQNQDAFFKVTGGVRLNEPAIDLAIAMGIASSYWNIPLEVSDVFIGEIGLTGEIRRVNQITSRIKEAAKLGFKRVFLPYTNTQDLKIDEKIEIIPVKTIQEAVEKVFPSRDRPSKRS